MLQCPRCKQIGVLSIRPKFKYPTEYFIFSVSHKGWFRNVFLVSSILPNNEEKRINLTTMVPQVELFLFVFWKNWRHKKTFQNHLTFNTWQNETINWCKGCADSWSNKTWNYILSNLKLQSRQQNQKIRKENVSLEMESLCRLMYRMTTG